MDGCRAPLASGSETEELLEDGCRDWVEDCAGQGSFDETAVKKRTTRLKNRECRERQ